VLLAGVMFLAPFPDDDSKNGAGWLVVAIIVSGLLVVGYNMGLEAWMFIRDASFFSAAQERRLIKLRKKLKTYLSLCGDGKYQLRAIQWILRSRLSGLVFVHDVLVQMRRQSPLIGKFMEGVCVGDIMTAKEKKADRKKRKKNGGYVHPIELMDADCLEGVLFLGEDGESRKDRLSRISQQLQTMTMSFESMATGETVMMDDMIDATKIFNPIFRVMVLEYLYNTQDKHVRAFQHVMELLKTNVLDKCEEGAAARATPGLDAGQDPYPKQGPPVAYADADASAEGAPRVGFVEEVEEDSIMIEQNGPYAEPAPDPTS
jgi:hypothetical protein